MAGCAGRVMRRRQRGVKSCDRWAAARGSGAKGGPEAGGSETGSGPRARRPRAGGRDEVGRGEGSPPGEQRQVGAAVPAGGRGAVAWCARGKGRVPGGAHLPERGRAAPWRRLGAWRPRRPPGSPPSLPGTRGRLSAQDAALPTPAPGQPERISKAASSTKPSHQRAPTSPS